MGKERLTAELLMQLYVKEGKSTVEIAKITNSHHETVRRALKKYNIHVRDKSQANLNYYKNGGQNPRKGLTLDEDEKIDISLGVKKFWLSEESKKAKESIANASRERWKKISKQEKRERVAELHRACRLASIHGSKSQNKIAQILRDRFGYKVETGVTQIAGIGKMEVDILLPSVGVAVEVDGVVHQEEVFSDNRLDRAYVEDTNKNKVLTGAGWQVIRVRIRTPRHSTASCVMACEQIHNIISNKLYNKNKISYIEMI